MGRTRITGRGLNRRTRFRLVGEEAEEETAIWFDSEPSSGMILWFPKAISGGIC